MVNGFMEQHCLCCARRVLGCQKPLVATLLYEVRSQNTVAHLQHVLPWPYLHFSAVWHVTMDQNSTSPRRSARVPKPRSFGPEWVTFSPSKLSANKWVDAIHLPHTKSKPIHRLSPDSQSPEPPAKRRKLQDQIKKPIPTIKLRVSKPQPAKSSSSEDESDCDSESSSDDESDSSDEVKFSDIPSSPSPPRSDNALEAGNFDRDPYPTIEQWYADPYERIDPEDISADQFRRRNLETALRNRGMISRIGLINKRY